MAFLSVLFISCFLLSTLITSGDAATDDELAVIQKLEKTEDKCVVEAYKTADRRKYMKNCNTCRAFSTGENCTTLSCGTSHTLQKTNCKPGTVTNKDGQVTCCGKGGDMEYTWTKKAK